MLAAPMLYILLRSCSWTLRGDKAGSTRGNHLNTVTSQKGQLIATGLPITQSIAIRFAIPQMVLATLALTTYHVQVITRLSSGYPLWYWWLASLTLDDHKAIIFGQKFSSSGLIIKWMMIYAVVQGGLFASFLPPA